MNADIRNDRHAVSQWAAGRTTFLRRVRDYILVFTVCVIVFWLFRERSHSGDYLNWIAYVDRGLWYRLREPICLVLYQIPLSLLRPYGVSAKGVLAGFSCVCGGLSFCYVVATLRLITTNRRLRILGVAAFALSYGVVGIFFGHIEHYSIMSLGCFAYVYYAVRYLKHSISAVAPALALGLLGTTHLMAAWLVPSLVVLPWLKPAGDLSGQVLKRRRRSDLIRVLAAFGLPNIAVWAAIIVTYYDASILNLLRDAATGEYSSSQYRNPGNPLGGGNRKGFWTLAEILSWSHLRETAYLIFIYSPVAWLGGIVTLTRSSREDLQTFIREPAARFFLALLIPYVIYMATWEGGLGPSRDWDLFSHVSIFLIYTVLLLTITGPGVKTGLVRSWILALFLSAILTGFLIIQTHRPQSPTGIAVLMKVLGVER